MSSTPDQQPIQRTVGKRVPRDGVPMTGPASEAARAATADRLRWTVDLMAERDQAAADQAR